MTPVTKSTPHATQSHDPITTRELKERHLLWPLSRIGGKHHLSDPIERLSTCDALMKSSAKAKSFHVAVRGSSPQHMTSPSRILKRVVGNLTPKSSAQSSLQSSKRSSESSSEESTESSNDYRNHQQNHQPKTVDHQRTTYRSSRQRVVDPPPTSGQPSDPTSDPSNDPPNDPPSESSPRNRAIRAIRRASRHRRACIERTAAIQASRRAAAGLVSNEPPRYEQAVGPPPGLRRTDRRDSCNPPAAAGPAPRIDDTPKRRVRRQLIGKETEGYVRSSRV